ncbi:SDR family oxidoreductase [Flavobacterium algicola]|uniref:SDR family oxidoreductase n=1 Tax=Flavobacterium algicola TaxID=556529 RepID=UPI001EFC5342|nr:SDR family oxidoreductase [Flavobacterium algicola]MCG9793372.1 SDR family oxidoreductase [Flavobacterium algicola]
MKKQTILITGAGSGLGKGSAIGLAKQGHKIIAAVHTWEQISRFKEDLKEADYKENIELIKLDILDVVDCEKAWEYDIDILVNNAGIGQTGPLAEIPVDYLREVMETNAFSTLEFSQPFIKKMVEKGKGKVIFLSSIAGLVTNPFLGPYNASKHALEAIAQCLRDELQPFGVTVATINPGPYETGFNDRVYDSYKQWFDENLHFTDKKELEKAAEGMAKNQFDPQMMIDKMVEVIPQEKHDFRTVYPEKFDEFCQEYQKRQYAIKTGEVDKSKK